VAAADRSVLRPPGRRYSFGWGSSSRKLTGPAIAATTITTTGAGRLGGNARGLQPWATTLLEATGRPTIQITAIPCRHGPPLSRPIARGRGRLRLGWEGQAHGTLWITGDTVLYDGVRQVADRLQVDTVLLHLGCVRFPVTRPVRYSMDAREAVEPCRLVRPRHRHPRPLRGLDPLPPGARCHQTAIRAGASTGIAG
jgi:hypothetical protein